MLAFSDLAEAIKDCPRGCGHIEPPADPSAHWNVDRPGCGSCGGGARLPVHFGVSY